MDWLLVDRRRLHIWSGDGEVSEQALVHGYVFPFVNKYLLYAKFVKKKKKITSRAGGGGRSSRRVSPERLNNSNSILLMFWHLPAVAVLGKDSD